MKGLTSSAVMGQGPGFVNQELTAALGHCNHNWAISSLGATEVYATIFIQFKCFGKLMLQKCPSPGPWRVIPSTSCWGRGDLPLIYGLDARQTSMHINGTELK